MRINRALAFGALLLMSASVTACGGDNSDDGGSISESGLPMASDMASVVSYVEKYVACQGLTTGEEYDTSHQGAEVSQRSNRSWGTDEAQDPAWGIKKRSVCFDDDGDAITLMLTPDMKKFQSAAAKKSENDYLSVDGSMLVGENFAIVASGTTHELLRDGGLMWMKCGADSSAPEGHEKEPSLVDGCVLIK